MKPHEGNKPQRSEKPDKRREFIDNDTGSVFRLEGRNPVLEALRNDKPIDTLLVKKGDREGSIRVITALAREKGILIKEMSKEKLDEIAQGDIHQGVIAMCAAHGYVSVDEILSHAKECGVPPFVVILDSITDPHNLGAILRTAECCGVSGLIIPKRRAVGLTPVVGKVSAGALEYVKIARVANLASAIDTLKKHGLWVFCGDLDGQTLFGSDMRGPVAIVIGGEGQGVSRLVKEKCDYTVKIPMMGKIGSLNASVAAGLIMYEVARQRL